MAVPLVCYPLRSKDEVHQKLKEFINLVERQTSRKMKILRTDNGLEYCNRPVQAYLTDKGIKHERTSPYSPQQNGVAERFNRVLFDGMRTLMINSNLPEELWVEAMMAMNYLRNRTIHSNTKDIPFRRWYGANPNLKYIRRFGCVAYLHVPPPNAENQSLKAEQRKGFLLGMDWEPQDTEYGYQRKNVFTRASMSLSMKRVSHTKRGTESEGA